MTKVEINISPAEWGNLVTKYGAKAKKLSNSDFTDGTVNIDTDVTGSLNKRKGGPNYNPTLLAAAPKDQFEAIFSDGARHLLVVQSGELKYSSGDTIFNTVVNGTGFSSGANFEFATTQDRVYMGNGVDANQVYDRIAVYGGAAAVTVPRLKAMGATAPSAAPTVAVAAGGAVPVGAHTYKITFEYYDSEESNGGPASAVATTTAGNQTVNLTAIPIGGYGVTSRKVYRDNNDGLWLHVGTVANNTATTFSDTLAVGVTPTEIPTNNGTASSAKYFTLFLDRLWLSGVPGDPYTLFYSEAQLPDIFGSENQILCNQEDPITGHVVYFDRLIVFNRRSFGQIIGSTPDTFRYAAIPGSVGCVDNRTIQTRVIQGVPILIWLSDKGFYTYNGNAIEYISEPIEDLVSFNIQQALQQQNSNSQTSEAQFSSGTASQGIDLTSNSGTITTKGYLNGTATTGTNPRRNFDDQGDWTGGTQISDLALVAGDNKLKAIADINSNVFSAGGGTLTGNMTYALTPRLTTSTNFTGANNDLTGVSTGLQTAYTFGAQKVTTVPRAGTISSISATVGSPSGGGATTRRFKLTLWADAGSTPGAVLFQSGILQQASGVATVHTITCSISIGSGIAFWVGIERIDVGAVGDMANVVLTSNSTFTAPASKFNAGAWSNAGLTSQHFKVGYTFNVTPIAKSGTWTSVIYDTQSTTATTCTLNRSLLTLNNFGTKATNFTVESSTNGVSFTSLFVSTSRTSGADVIALSGQRYFRLRISFSTTDDRETDALLSPLTLVFLSPVSWISSVIDTTSDVTAYNSLTTSEVIPSGGSVAYTVATSANNITYTAFGSFGSATIQRYIKIKAAITKTSAGVSPTISSIILKWTLVSNLISSSIDTAVTPPAGWDIFLSQYATNSGTVVFQMRSATTSGGLGAATFFTIVPGTFPTIVTPLQFVQWKVIITSSDLQVPAVDSVTIQWFISLVASIRPASIFVDGRYYVAVAESESTTNNILLGFDLNGKWRRHDGLAIATFSFFFNRPYLGLATSGQIRKFLEGFLDGSSNITFDYRTKAFDFSTTQFDNYAHRVKVVGEMIIQGSATDAVFTAFYSVDEGETFYPLYENDGTTTFTLSDLPTRLRPNWDNGSPISGRTILYKIFNNDANEVQIDNIKLSALVREQEPVITG